jgi:hypothetical protein
MFERSGYEKAIPLTNRFEEMYAWNKHSWDSCYVPEIGYPERTIGRNLMPFLKRLAVVWRTWHVAWFHSSMTHCV